MQEAFIDGNFTSAKKAKPLLGLPISGKETNLIVVVDGQGIPLGGTIALASPAEVTLAKKNLETVNLQRNGHGLPKNCPFRLIGDKGSDSDPLRKRLKEHKIYQIVLH